MLTDHSTNKYTSTRLPTSARCTFMHGHIGNVEGLTAINPYKTDRRVAPVNSDQTPLKHAQQGNSETVLANFPLGLLWGRGSMALPRPVVMFSVPTVSGVGCRCRYAVYGYEDNFNIRMVVRPGVSAGQASGDQGPRCKLSATPGSMNMNSYME